MIDISRSSIPRKTVSVNYRNPDIRLITSSFTGSGGRIETVEKNIIVPDMRKLVNGDIVPMELDISIEYPFKVITPVTDDSSSLLLSPALTTFPTASQNYYIPLYAERFVSGFMLALTREFTEFTVQSSSRSTL